jgi:flagellar assembly factor FliW
MTMVTIQTSRFGPVTADDATLITFISPILGFETEKSFLLLDHADESPFKWLQSVDNADLAFVVSNPKLFGINYEFSLPDSAVEKLKVEQAEDILVFTIVNIPEHNPSLMTANLLAPIVIHHPSRKAMQVVLDDQKLSTRTRLLPEVPAESAVGSREEGQG